MFFDVDELKPKQPFDSVNIRVAYGENVMMAYVNIEANVVLPEHSHPHEQGGILLKGRLELTIGEEVRIVEAGSLFIVPPNTVHRAAAVDGPAVVLDVFSPVREDYAQLYNRYIPAPDSDAQGDSDTP